MTRVNNVVDVNRRTVLKAIGASTIGGTVLTGSASAHGNDHRVPAWFEGEIAEMAEYPPFGDIEDESTVPLWTIAPGADGKSCPQMDDFGRLKVLLDPDPRFERGAWDSVDFDHTLSANPFSALWHVHFVFDPNVDPMVSPYTPSDLLNTVGTDPLTDGETIRDAIAAGMVAEVSIPFGFNCPIRPADEEHRNYCD